jgi:3-deoxy-D-manno-octulosonic-acid transferase
MLPLYTLVFSLLLLLAGPLWLPLALLWPRARKGLLQRFGVAPREARELMYVGEGSLWVHAASLGEVNAVAPVVRALLEKLTGVPLVFTCTTLAGVEQAGRLFPESAARLLMPFDLPLFLTPLFRRYKPRFVILTETELWPNFIGMLRRSGAQILLANGRMSARSLGRYLRFRPLFAETLLCFDTLAIQSEEDAERFIALGAKPSRTVVTGNTKFDVAEAAKAARRKGGTLREELGLAEGAPLIVAGSTRPGEEGPLLEAFKEIKARVPGLKLLLAPRHLERLAEVEGLAADAGLSLSRRSQGASKADVILLDSLGELASAYSFASLAWIGGGWGPFGGQNPLEAAAQGCALIFGPDMAHFKEPARILLGQGAALQLEMSEVAAASLALLKDAAKREAMGRAGLEALKQSAGASQRTADLAWKLAVMARLRRDERDWRNQSAFASLKVSEFGHSHKAGLEN